MTAVLRHFDSRLPPSRRVWHWRLAIGRGDTAVQAVGALLVVLGVMALTVGQFVPMRLRGEAQQLISMLHLLEGGAAVVIVVAAIGFAATAFGRSFRSYSLATIVVVLAFGAWGAMEASRIEAGLATPWVGVKERIFWYAYELWFMVLALTLLRQRPGDRESR